MLPWDRNSISRPITYYVYEQQLRGITALTLTALIAETIAVEYVEKVPMIISTIRLNESKHSFHRCR